MNLSDRGIQAYDLKAVLQALAFESSRAFEESPLPLRTNLIPLVIDLMEFRRLLAQFRVQAPLLDPPDPIPKEAEGRRSVTGQKSQIGNPPAIPFDHVSVIDDDVPVPEIKPGDVKEVETVEDHPGYQMRTAEEALEEIHNLLNIARNQLTYKKEGLFDFILDIPIEFSRSIAGRGQYKYYENPS